MSRSSVNSRLVVAFVSLFWANVAPTRKTSSACSLLRANSYIHLQLIWLYHLCNSTNFQFATICQNFQHWLSTSWQHFFIWSTQAFQIIWINAITFEIGVWLASRCYRWSSVKTVQESAKLARYFLPLNSNFLSIHEVCFSHFPHKCKRSITFTTVALLLTVRLTLKFNYVADLILQTPSTG